MASFLRISLERRKAVYGHRDMGAGVLPELSFPREVFLQKYSYGDSEMHPLWREAELPKDFQRQMPCSTNPRMPEQRIPTAARQLCGGRSQLSLSGALPMAETSMFATEGRPSSSQVGPISCSTDTTWKNQKRVRLSSWLFPSRLLGCTTVSVVDQ